MKPPPQEVVVISGGGSDAAHAVTAEGTRSRNASNSNNESANLTAVSRDSKPDNSRRTHTCYGKRNFTEKTLLLISFGLAVVCTVLVIFITTDHSRRAGSDVCMTKECIQAASSILSKLDTTIDPCQDFYSFACGNYVRQHVVPDDHYIRSTLQQMQEDVYIVVKKLIEENISTSDSATTVKLKTLYNSCMNESFLDNSSPLTELLTPEVLGLWPIVEPKYKATDGSNFELERVLAQLAVFQVQPFVGIHVSTDFKNSSVYLMQFIRGSPALEREYYVNASHPDQARYLRAYEHLLVSVAQVLGAKAEIAQADATALMEFEKRFANISQSKWYQDEHNSTDEDDGYNKLSIAELQEEVSEINWTKLLGYIFEVLDFDMDESSLSVIVHCREYLRELGALLQATPKRVVSNYLLWRFILKYMPFADRELRRLYTDFRKDVPDPGDRRLFCARWKECVNIVSDGMGLGIGAMYVRNFSSAFEIKQIEAMIDSVQGAFLKFLHIQDWLDNETKHACHEKLQAMGKRIGYPQFILDDKILDEDYEDLEVSGDRLLTNVLNMMRFEFRKELLKLKRPVNKDRDWLGSPVEVNAFYRPNFNEIIFPAGILRDPIFNPNRPMYLNYGSVGVVIGHEIIHGFDNQGRRYDKYGNMTQWWPDDTIEKFNKEAACFAEQYSNYQLGDSGHYVNGNETLGDNICDNAGLLHAYIAYRDWVKRNHEEPMLPGINFTSQQLFFITYAQIWCEVVGKEGYEKYTKDIHSPGQYRTIGVLSNSPEFAAAFKCPVGSPMNPEKKCRLWG